MTRKNVSRDLSVRKNRTVTVCVTQKKKSLFISTGFLLICPFFLTGEGGYGGGGYGGGGEYGSGGYGGGYGGGGETTVINEDGGWFVDDKQTIVQTGIYIL
jgi:hypothetical protein